MKKIGNRGFLLAETLIVTTFAAGVLIFIFIQFTNLKQNYEISYKYNTIEGLYALEDIRNYILSDPGIVSKIESSLDSSDYIDIKNCSGFTDIVYCHNLFDIVQIDNIIVTKNDIPNKNIKAFDKPFRDFIKKINGKGNSKYRLIASFNNSTYATLRFGDSDE